MNSRVNEAGQVMRDGEQVEIGGNDRYVSCAANTIWKGGPSNNLLFIATCG